MAFTILLLLSVIILERENVSRGSGRGRERISTEPYTGLDVGLDPMTLGLWPEPNQGSNVQPTEPLRHPKWCLLLPLFLSMVPTMCWRQELLLLHAGMQPRLPEWDQWSPLFHTLVTFRHWWCGISQPLSPSKKPQKRPRRKEAHHLLYILENLKFCLWEKRKVKDIHKISGAVRRRTCLFCSVL